MSCARAGGQVSNPKELTPAQKSCLSSLENSASGVWVYQGRNGWSWDTPSRTRQILQALANKGLVTADEDGRTFRRIDGE